MTIGLTAGMRQTIIGAVALRRPFRHPCGTHWKVGLGVMSTGGIQEKARSNSTANRLDTDDRAVHDWYRFVLSFPPHLVRDYLQRFHLTAKHLVLDPFCGTGTTLVECKKCGVPSVGVEANTMACFASRIKVDWSPDGKRLLAHARKVADTALEILNLQGIDDHAALFQRGRPCNPKARIGCWRRKGASSERLISAVQRRH